MRRRRALIILVIIVIAIIAVVSTIPPPAPTVTVSSVYNLTQPNMTFLVNVTVSDAVDVAVWVLNMTWDPNVIKITTGDPNGLRVEGKMYNIYEGPFMKDVTRTAIACNEIDNLHGKMTMLACFLMTPGVGASGSGVLATINFTSISAGTANLKIDGPSVKFPGHSVLQDANGNEISHEDIEGIVTDKEQPIPPIWTQPWFLPAIIGVIIVIVVVAYVTIKMRRLRSSIESKKNPEKRASS